jgi:cytochrome b
MEPTVKVWDAGVRLFHWCLVTSFAVAWLTADSWDDLHEWAGYAAAALVVYRVLWGLAGPRYARFAQFVRAPGAVLDYFEASLRGREPRYVGHNPLGALMILALIAVMLASAVTGWMYTLDAFWGTDWVEEAHESLANLMLLMVAVHVAGVVLASLRHRENLVRAMVTGRKRAPESSDVI